jgi:predicted membrane-bound spermidine synthase
MSPLGRILLYSTVFITGAIVLMLEVSAVRLFAPYFGSSLTVLSSVLTVILLALSFGYSIGGRLADRAPSATLLMTILGLAGVSTLALFYLSLTTLPALAPDSILFTPLILALLFFFLPALLLGIDSPFVAKLLTLETSGKEGTIVGNVFFVSTLGSIAGSLSAGFYFIPTHGLINTIIGSSLVLVLWTASYLAIVVGKKTERIIALTLLMVIFILLMLRPAYPPTPRGGEIVTTRDGLYSSLLVYDIQQNGTTYRFLKNDVNLSSGIALGTSTLPFPYATLATSYEPMVPTPQNYLVLGGGAFTIPQAVHKYAPSLTIETVEVEPYLPEIAKKYFGVTDAPELRTHTTDARVYLNESTSTYDVIFSDVMNSGHYIPPHLLTTEFFALLKSRLAPDGVILMNYIGSLDTRQTTMTGSLTKTIMTSFNNYKLIPMDDEKSKGVQNIMIVMRHEGQPITFGETHVPDTLFGPGFRIDDRLTTISEKDLMDETIFTDNALMAESLMAKQLRLHR